MDAIGKVWMIIIAGKFIKILMDKFMKKQKDKWTNKKINIYMVNTKSKI
jgi:hypothetical protein